MRIWAFFRVLVSSAVIATNEPARMRGIRVRRLHRGYPAACWGEESGDSPVAKRFVVCTSYTSYVRNRLRNVAHRLRRYIHLSELRRHIIKLQHEDQLRLDL